MSTHANGTNNDDDIGRAAGPPPADPPNGWLCLGRREGEVVRIGDDIEVMVVHAERGWARLAFRAPRHVVIDREEVRLRKGRDAGAGEGEKDEL